MTSDRAFVRSKADSKKIAAICCKPDLRSSIYPDIATNAKNFSLRMPRKTTNNCF